MQKLTEVHENRESPVLHSCANLTLWKPHVAATRSHFPEPTVSRSSCGQAFPWCAVLTPLWVWHLQMHLGCHTQWALLTQATSLNTFRGSTSPMALRRSSLLESHMEPHSRIRDNTAFRLVANGAGKGGSRRVGVYLAIRDCIIKDSFERFLYWINSFTKHLRNNRVTLI